MKNRDLLRIVAVLVGLLVVLLAVLLLMPGNDQTSPTTEATEPTTIPPEPTTDPAEPSTEATEPTTEPTVAPTAPPTEPSTEPQPEVLAPMGEIHITTGTAVTANYSDALLRAQWDAGQISEQTVKLRIRGYSSTWTKKKSYNIKFTEKTDLFGMGEGKKWCLISNAYDKTLLRNAIAMDYAEALGLPYVPAHRFCKVYMDGTYLGIYLAMEPVSEGANRVDLDLSAGDFLIERNRKREEAGVTYLTTNHDLRFELNEPETVDDARYSQILQQLNAVVDAVRTFDHTVYEQYIDVDSFVNFYLFHEYFKDVDFAQYSTRYFMKNGILYAGPPWDLDLSMGNVSAKAQEWKYWNYNNQDESTDQSGDSTRAFWAQKDFYMWLWQDAWFRDQVMARWQQVREITRNLYADNALGVNQLDRYLEAYQPELETNYAKDGAGWPLGWPCAGMENQSPARTLIGNVDILRDWLDRRAQWLDGQFGISQQQ